MFKFRDDVFIKAGFHIGQKGMVVDFKSEDNSAPRVGVSPNEYLILIENSGNYKKWFGENELEPVGPRVKIY